MKIYVDLANPAAKGHFADYLSLFRELSLHDLSGNHTLVFAPESADCILFIDAHVSLTVDYYSIVDNHPLTKKFPEKVMVYDEYDRPPSYGRGIYVSLPRPLFNPKRHAVVCYWKNEFEASDNIDSCKTRTDYCFFAGAVSYNPTRARIVKHLTGSIVHVKDTSAVSPWKSGADAPTKAELEQSRRDYSDLMMNHQYCLAPLGKGTASIRMFEAFLHGTVPIVMANEYVSPDIVAWDDCVVKINQRRPRDIVLRQHELQGGFNDRQQKAREIQHRYFAFYSRWNFFGDQLERVLNSDPYWKNRSKTDAVKSKLYWLQHRVLKRLENGLVKSVRAF